jgi:hypothetical protein
MWLVPVFDQGRGGVSGMKRTHDEVGASVSATARAACLDDDEDEDKRVRCSEDEDGPTLEVIFNEVLQQNPKNHARNQHCQNLHIARVC